MRYGIAGLIFCLWTALAFAQEPIDPAFDPPMPSSDAPAGKIRWNGTIGIVIINGQVYQQFGLRPDIPFGKWGVGLDLTFRFDPNGDFKDDEWDEGRDYIEKIYYVRYGLPGDPLYARVGALDNVTLGYGIIMRRYSNTIQYPEIKRIGAYTEGQHKKVGWQAMINNLTELDQPGLLAARFSYETPLNRLTLGATVANDGNQFAGLQDHDNDGVPDPTDKFPGANDFARRAQLYGLLLPYEIDSLIDWGYLPDIRQEPLSYKGLKESVTLLGADVGLPILKGRPVSLWGYAQAAKIVDHGWGWAFPGARMVIGPLDVGAEYRQYYHEFRGDYFNYVYEIERVQLKNDTFVTKEKTLEGLGRASGYYADALLSFANIGYLFGWYEDMHGNHYAGGKTLYGEAGITPPQVTRLQKVAGYYMEPHVNKLFGATRTDGTIYGAKVFIGLAQNVAIVYDHRVTFYNGERHRTVRIETMFTF